MLAIAHRSGNTVAGLRAALDAGVDLVEADVHLHRGRLEVRHLRTMGGLPLLWDRTGVVHRRRWEPVELTEVLDALGADHRLMIDLKGVHPRLAPTVAGLLRSVAPDRSLTVCTKAWWMLDAFDLPVNRVLSAATGRGLSRLRERLATEPVQGTGSGTGHVTGPGSVRGVSVRVALLTRELVDELHRTTDLVMAWPVDTAAALAHARAVGVDAVISKNLDLLRGVIAERGPG